MNITCPVCKGTGLEKREAVQCPCEYTFCYKCENNEGFFIKPYEECRKCDGSGKIDLNFERIIAKPFVDKNDISKPFVDKNDISKPFDGLKKK